MVLKYKLTKDQQCYEIEANDITLIKVALLVHYGHKTAFHLFQKKIESSLLFYVPHERDRINLVKMDFNTYIQEHTEEIKEAISTIKEL